MQPAPAGVRVFVRDMPEGARVEYVVSVRTEFLSMASVCDADARDDKESTVEDSAQGRRRWLGI